MDTNDAELERLNEGMYIKVGRDTGTSRSIMNDDCIPGVSIEWIHNHYI